MKPEEVEGPGWYWARNKAERFTSDPAQEWEVVLVGDFFAEDELLVMLNGMGLNQDLDYFAEYVGPLTPPSPPIER